MGQTITSDNEFDAYLAEPDGGADVRGGIVLIHEIWGLVPHITDVADRLAAQGYVTIAPDLITEVGISAETVAELQRVQASNDPEERNRLQPLMREKLAPLQAPGYADWAVRGLRRCLDQLADRPGVDGRLAVLGFCFGGTYAFALAAADDRIQAAVPFYGAPPEQTSLPEIGCPVLAFYGDQDERLMAGLPQVREQMATAGVDFADQVYPGVGHAFFNDANPRAYDAESAADAWRRSLDFLDRNLITVKP